MTARGPATLFFASASLLLEACVTTDSGRHDALPGEDEPGLQIEAPNGHDLRARLLSALERRDGPAVWALLGPGPQAQFEGVEARFVRWCDRYCTEWLIEAAATSPTPTERVVWGDVVVVVDGDGARVDAGPGLPAGRTVDAALGRLRTTLRALASDPLFDVSRRAAWTRLEAGLARATARPAASDASWTLRVDGGTVVFTRDGERWVVSRFEAEL